MEKALDDHQTLPGRFSLEPLLSFFYMCFRTFVMIFRPPFRWKLFCEQIHFATTTSLPVICFCVSFAAMVTIIEAAFHMQLVLHNISMVPGFAALLILRELGVVISALLIVSRVGAGMAAEVGSMQITEQVDALKMLGIDPVQYLVVPRFLACMLGGIAISVISNVVCLSGAMLVASAKLGMTTGEFWMGMSRFVKFQDFVFAMIKGGVFGAIIPLICCYFGFRCKAGAEGVGLATTNSVVSSSITIIVVDFILSWLFSHFY